MTRDEAKRILSWYRPWTNDAKDPEFAEALALAQQDTELGQWFAQHCASHSAVHAGFKVISPPPGLKEQIISEHQARLRAAKWGKPRTLVATMAGLTALITLSVWLAGSFIFKSENDFTRYRGRMAKIARRAYYMDLYTNNPAAIRTFLTERQSISNYTLTTALSTATNTGCKIINWQSNQVAMVCFYTGRPLAPGDSSDLFLFVMKRDAAVNTPKSDKPQFAQVNSLATATWTQDGLVYLLAAPGDAEFLKKYL